MTGATLARSLRWATAILLFAWISNSAHAQQTMIGANGLSGQILDVVNQPAANTSSFEFDYGVPSSPALSLAGLSTTKVTSSTSLQSFLLSLPAAIGSGAPNQSLALDIAPSSLFVSPLGLNADRYQSMTKLERILVRAHFGVAGTNGNASANNPSKAATSELAFALSTSLLDDSDPLAGNGWLSETNCFNTQANHNILEGIQSIVNKGGPISNEFSGLMSVLLKVGNHVGLSPDEKNFFDQEMRKSNSAQISDLNAYAGKLQPQAQQELINIANSNGLQKVVTGCAQQATNAIQNSYAFDVGLGSVWTGTDGEFKDFSSPSATGWMGLRIPMDKTECNQKVASGENATKSSDFAICWLVGGSFRYSYETMVSTTSKTVPKVEANVLDAWIGLEHLGDLNVDGDDHPFKIDAQLGYLDQHAVLASQSSFSESGARWLIGVSADIFPQNGVWVVASYGNVQGTSTSLNDHVFMLTLNFGAPKASSIFGTPSSVQSDGTSTSGAGTPPPGG